MCLKHINRLPKFNAEYLKFHVNTSSHTNVGICMKYLQQTKKMRVHPMLARTYRAVHRLFSDGGDIRVLHNDLYDKNILVNAQAKVERIIDLDAVALCNESFSVMMTLRTYPLTNNLEYMEYYEDTMGRKINRSAITKGLQILDAIRKPQVALNRLLWRGYNTAPGR